MNVIPSVICSDLEGVVAVFHRLEKFLPAGSFIHLDICDGQFTPNRTWADPVKWLALLKHLKVQDVRFEAHLMVNEPETVLEPWLRAGAKRAIVHVECLHDSAFIHRACGAYGAEAMLALNPETPSDKLRPHLGAWTAFQTLAVNPGFAGQKFLPVVLEKIKFLRAEVPRAIIEVDGGINLETAMLVKACGADTVVSASYVLEAVDPGAAFRELQDV
jgi:ribulose-phosphate 3-epimerase